MKQGIQKKTNRLIENGTQLDQDAFSLIHILGSFLHGFLIFFSEVPDPHQGLGLFDRIALIGAILMASEAP
ncbi:hypothetical protein SCOR_29635 [Sulfidibacter corallicola]